MRQHLSSPISYLLSPICRSCAAPRRKNGFTLIEMMTVVVLISLLLMSIGLSARSARRHALRTKAEAECRELVTAMIQYHQLYGEWPGSATVANNSILGPLTDPTQNKNGLVFLNLTYSGGDWKDPWGKTYQIIFPSSEEDAERETALETCVSFPYRWTPF